MRFHFVTWEGGGVAPPELAVAARLVARGHAVTVQGDPCLGDDAAAAGAAFVPWRDAPHRRDRSPESDFVRDWEARTAYGAFVRSRDRHAFGPAHLFAREVVAAHRACAADVVVADGMLFGGLAGAEATGAAFAALVPMTSFLPGPGRPPPGIGLRPARGALGWARDLGLLALGDGLLWRSCLAPLNRARAAVGLGPVGHPLDQLRRARRVLCLTSPRFDFDAPERRGNVVYTGPELADRAGTDAAVPVAEGPIVLVSLSSSPMGQTELLRRLVAALATLPVHAVVTVGPSLRPSELAAPPNVTVLGFAPHGALLPRARLVVTHAGHGTVMRALAHGVPLVCLPMGRDQGDNAARVVALGAGLRLSARSGVGALRAAIRRGLEDGALGDGARAFARTLAAEQGRDRAVAELEALA